MHKLSQKGFAVIETLLVVIIIIALVGVGAYVWHANKQTSQTLDRAAQDASSSPAQVKKKTVSNKTAQEATAPQSDTSANVTVARYKYHDLPADLQQAILTYAQRESPGCYKGQTTANYGDADATITYASSGYATAPISDCDSGSDHLFVKQNGTWSMVESTQDGWSCTTFEKYKVPKQLVILASPTNSSSCVDSNHNEIPYDG